jgi:hypothetical protein
VFYRLATGAGTHNYENPVQLDLVTVRTDSESPIEAFSPDKVFANDPRKFFQSFPKPTTSLDVSLPKFLRVAPTAYTIRGPPGSGALKSWTFEGSEDSENWSLLDNVVDNPDLAPPGSERTFELSEIGPFCRWFRITQRGTNHEKNHAFRMSRFDVNGEVKLIQT